MIIVYFENKVYLGYVNMPLLGVMLCQFLIKHETLTGMSLVKKSLNKTRDCSDKPRPSIGREEGCRYFPIDTKL